MGILYFKLMYTITTEMTIALENCCHKRFMILSFFWILYEFYFWGGLFLKILVILLDFL